MKIEIGKISGLSENELQSIHEAIVIVSESIVQLKQMILKIGFSTSTDEIKFFKNIKPEFDGTLIFFLTLLRIHSCIPSDNSLDKQKFYSRELENLNPLYKKDFLIWQYYQMNDNSLDEIYFVRRKQNIYTYSQEDQIHYDWDSNALMSYQAARIYAYDLLRNYLDGLLVSEPELTEITKNGKCNSLYWSGSKAMLTELIYSLHEYGVFNHSQVEIKRIADYFSKVFNIKFSNIYKTYEDIRLRKKNPTPFLDNLKSALERRINRDNEHAL